MQGDIMLPRPPKRPRPAPKLTYPSPGHPHHHEPIPDISIDEARLEPEELKKDRKVLIAPHKHFKRLWRWWTSLNRNVRFGAIGILLLIIGAGAIGWYHFIQPSSYAYIGITKHQPKPVKPVTVASPLTGVQVAPDLAKRPVTGIMIENSEAARPQSGLQDAGVVFEAIAEGGVTRFLALFQESEPQYIGPVRSLRPYFLDYASAFQASIVHVGGSPDALSEVRDGTYRDLDQFFNSDAYWRVSSRYAPHNVYTSFAKLDALNQARGYTSSSFTSWPRKVDKKLATPTAKTIDFKISGPDYYVHYNYNPADNSYLRSEGGVAHMDLVSAADRSGVQLQPKVVIAIVVPLSHGALDATGAYYSDYGDVGSGTAYIFQDGGVTQATWTKSSDRGQISFTDPSGAPVKLNAGQTWVTLVSDDSQVSYQP